MTGIEKPLRWKDHSLFPYTCKGCGVKHPKGDGVYLDQSGPRTVTYDNPQCAQQGAPGEGVRKSPVTDLQSRLSTPPLGRIPQTVSGESPRLPFPAVPDGHDQVTLTVNLQGGKSVEVVLRMQGEGMAKPTMDRLVADVSRVVMEDLS
jgi:hypothetical protein